MLRKWNTKSALTIATLMVIVVGAVAGCVASQPKPRPNSSKQAEARRHAYVKAHPELSAHMKQVILQGSVETGMTEAEVIASLGPPTGGITTASTPGHTHEQWIDGTSIFYFDNGILSSYQK